MTNSHQEGTIEIEAGAHAFGDGEHPSTRGALAMLGNIDAQIFTPTIACDIGTGSGILAFYMAQQFVCPVVAVDVAVDAVEALQRNIAHNHMSVGIVKATASIQPVLAEGFHHPHIARHAPYDVIVANILAEPLIALAQDIQAHLASGGIAILSGIMLWQEQPVLQAYEAVGLERMQRIVIGDWVTLGFGKP